MSRLVNVGLVLSVFAACDHVNPGALVNPTPIEVPPSPPPSQVIFTEDFDSGSLAMWEDGVDPARHRIVTDSRSAQSGDHYLAVTYPAGRDGGWLTRFVMPGYDTMYVSFYVRFPRNWLGGTKLLGLYGSRTDDKWSAFGKAGICPNGNDFFDAMLITTETGNPGPLKFYTYFPAMFREPDGVTCWGRYTDQAGRAAAYSFTSTLTPEVWHHLEFTVELNQPGQSNGTQNFRVDGKDGARWAGIAFRNSSVLRLNAVQLSFSSGATGVTRTQQLDIDNIEVRGESR